MNPLLRWIKSLIWLISRLFGKRRKFKKDEQARKRRAYVWNFVPSRLKNVSYQKTDKKAKKSKRKFPNKKDS